MSETQAPPAATVLADPNAERAWLPEEFRADPALSTFKDVASLAKSFKDTQAFVGADKAALLKLPKDETDEAGWSEVWNRLGRPENPDGYQIEAPAAVQPETLAAFRAFAHKAGIPQRHAAEVMKFYGEHVGAIETQAAKAADDEMVATKTALEREWGDAFQANTHAINRLLTTHGGSEALAAVNAAGLGRNLHFLKAMAKLAAATAEPGELKGGSGGGMGGGTVTRESAASEWAGLQRDQAWQAKYLSGDVEAVAQARRLFAVMHGQG